MTVQELFEQDFATLAALVGAHAAERPDHVALIHHDRRMTYGELDRLMDRVAAALQCEGLAPQDVIAICALSSIEYVATFLGALRAGMAVAPLAPSSTPEQLAVMVADCGAKLFFLDQGVGETIASVAGQIRARRVALDGSASGAAFTDWLAPMTAKPQPVEIDPTWAFNIIYSSGTTGTPKGIVQSHRMRWSHVGRAGMAGYGPEAVTLVSTPLYSNTTLVCVIPTLAGGGAVVLLEKFDVVTFLELAQAHRATHAILVPVQYRRLMAHPDFEAYDLSSFRMKFSTSAPFAAALKADVLRRWPGGLIEYYGMTEGGGSVVLVAHEHPDKLHTVGRAGPGVDIRLIDEQGREVGVGEVGEVVGHSPATMNGYHNQPEKTAEAEWWDPSGRRFIRTGDVGRFDEDGFLTLMDRKKDMIISGGFNIYPSDLEAAVAAHSDVLEVAVVGVPSESWGETPIALVVLKPGAKAQADPLRAWVNERLGKTQRLAALEILDSLPRSAIGKVLKRELRDRYAGLVKA